MFELLNFSLTKMLRTHLQKIQNMRFIPFALCEFYYAFSEDKIKWTSNKARTSL